MNTRVPFVLFAFGALLFFLPAQGTAQVSDIDRTPPVPNIDDTYYYEGYDAPNDRHVFVSSSGTYYYVDSGGSTTVGDAADLGAIASPYRVIVSGGTIDFQFYNNNPYNYTLATITGSDGTVITATDFSVRSGTWFASDITLNLSKGDASGIWVEGVSAAFPLTAAVTGSNIIEYADGTARVIYDQPVVFSGTNINIFSDVANNSSRQAISIRNGGAVFLYGGTISKTVTTTGDGSETIYLVGNQEGQGTSAYFHGEDLTIISTGTGLETFVMGNGNTIVELYRTTITATAGGGPNTQVFKLNDQQSQGGAHFYGEDITINNYQGRTFAFGYGGNSITLKNSTITASGTKGAVFRWITAEGAGGGAGGSEAMADGYTSTVSLENTNVTTTADYAPIFQQTGRLGAATVTGGTLITTGTGSPILRLLGANDAQDETLFTGIFTNVVLEARNSSAIDLDLFLKDSTNYGEDGGGIAKYVTTNISTTWELVFVSSTLTGTSAIRMANAGAPESPFNNWTNVHIYDSTFNGRIEMLADGGGANLSYETSGASLTLRAFNSVFTGGFFITGSDNARRSHQALLELKDCTYAGDIVGTNRGTVVLKFFNTPLTGDLVFSGSTIIYLDFIDSPITGGIHLDDTAQLMNNPGLDLDNRRAIILNSAITGGFNLAGSSSLDLTLSGPETVVSNGITASDNATAIIRLEDNSSINDGVTVSGSSSVTLVLSDANQLAGDLEINDRARLVLSTFAGTPINIDRGLALAGIWGITGKTTLGGLLEVTHPLGTISIDNASPDILTLTSGFSGNGRLDIASIDGVSLGTSEIRVVYDPTKTFAPDALILSHPVDYGLAAYTLENREDGAYLVGGLDKGSFGTGGAAVFNSQALMVEDWLANFAPLDKHLSELRQINASVFSHEPAAHSGRGDTGTLWLKARASTTQVDAGSDSLNFDSRTIGLTAGIDARWDFATAALTSGLFLDTARTDRDFIETAEGSSSSVGGGFYIQYHHRKGFFISAIARFDTCETDLNTHSPNNALAADYNSQAGGGAIDLGWRFELANSGWWCEPAYQLALASFPGVSYDTQSSKPENNITISIADARATQNLLRLALGRALGRKWSFHGYLAAATVSASGGEFSAPGLDRANFLLAGDRVEASIGMTRQIGHAGRITLNAAYIEADDYMRPCSFSLGYSYLW